MLQEEQSFQPLPDRIPPQIVEAEEAILGSILLDPEAISRISERLKPEAFYISAHREIYYTALRLYNQSKPTDLTTVAAYLQDEGKLDKVGGQSRLAQLVDRTISTANVDQYAELVIDKAVRRQLIKAGNEIIQLGYDTRQPLEKVLDKAEQQVFNLAQNRPQSRGLTATASILAATFNEIEQRSTGEEAAGIACNFYDLDAMTQGFQRSDLIIVAGRPSMGKTSFVLSAAHNIAAIHRKAVCIFSLEMSKEQLVYRLLSSEVGIESGRLRAGRVRDDEWATLCQGMNNLSELPIYIDDTPDLTVTDMRSKARQLALEQNTELGLVLIDYLQLMEGASPDNRVQELSKITRALKGMARELNVPVITLSQLSRGVESRTNKRPMMSDLRESGCLTGDTLITLAESGERVALQDLVGRSGFKVWAVNPETWQLEVATVSNSFCTGTKPVLRLTTQLGRSIRATANHKFLTLGGWKRLDELQPQDYIALPRRQDSKAIPSMEQSELALLGHMIGDGCTLPRHAIQYTTRELDLAKTVVNLAIEVFGETLSPRIVQERQWYQVYLAASQRLTHRTRNPVASWLDSLNVFGLRSHEKYVPNKVFEQPSDWIATFMRHLWSTDGSIKLVAGRSPRPIAFYASSSAKLARDVQSLLLRLSINARLKKVAQSKGRDQYHVIITGQPDIKAFIQVVGAVGHYKQQSVDEIQNSIASRTGNPNRDVIPKEVWEMIALPKLQSSGMTQRGFQARLNMSYCGTSLFKQNLSRNRADTVAQVLESPKLQSLAQSDVYWDEIATIEPEGCEPVYDLTVPGLHNFVANDIIVHNSIEQDADLIIMLYRDEYYNPDTPDRGITEVIITKHRNGPIGTVKLLFEPQFTRFRNLANPI